MARWDSRGVLPDVPRGGQREPVANQDSGPLDPEEAAELDAIHDGRGRNRQTSTPGWDDARRKRWSWIRSNIADVAGDGHMPDRADIDRLPAAHRAEARAICEEAAEMHRAGSQMRAHQFAQERFSNLEATLGRDWIPPASHRPTAELLDAIQGRPV